MSETDRLANALLNEILKLIPDSRAYKLYQEFIICPQEAASMMLLEFNHAIHESQ